jgi:acyl-homoserine lactone acylase PvdQ
MGRIISTGETAAKQRHAHIRSCAEVLRLLAERSCFDEEARDMAAFFVLNLRGIYETIDESAQAWDERNYWKKAEALRDKWRWSRSAADELEALILSDRWGEVPPLLIRLIPKFNDVTITSITRDADWWCGALKALKKRKGTV